ncbi:rhodanese-like domain-containing protein [Actinospica acidiphila]|nr:rhodanese-like domain-containing protein [Actinospica acidiphila]
MKARTRTGDGAAVLLDVRETQEWSAGHAPGAVHLPLPLSRLAADAALPPGLRDAGRRRHQPAGHHGQLPGLARHPLGRRRLPRLGGDRPLHRHRRPGRLGR